MGYPKAGQTGTLHPCPQKRVELGDAFPKPRQSRVHKLLELPRKNRVVLDRGWFGSIRNFLLSGNNPYSLSLHP